MSVSCGRARRLLWPDAGPREATAEIVAARGHAAGCEACQGFLDDMRRIAERIGGTAPRPAARAEVRDRLFKAVARARTASGAPARGNRPRQMLAAVLAALLLVGLSVLGHLAVQNGSNDADTIGSIVEDRLRNQRGAKLASSDSLEVVQWLAERLPFAIQVPLFPGARLSGARLLVAGRQSGAVVEYVVGGRTLTYYVLSRTGGGLQGEIRLASREGYRVASWNDAGLTHALVATLPGPELIEFARYCIHQMMATLMSGVGVVVRASRPEAIQPPTDDRRRSHDDWCTSSESGQSGSSA